MPCSHSVIDNNDTELMRQVAFSSDELPPGIDDLTRFAAWKAFLSRVCGPLEVSRRPDLPFSQRMDVMRLLRRYLEIVPSSDDIEADPDVTAHIGRTVMDLLVLALCAEGDATEIARFRGLRAARQQQILAEIRTGFADPAFSEPRLAS